MVEVRVKFETKKYKRESVTACGESNLVAQGERYSPFEIKVHGLTLFDLVDCPVTKNPPV